MRGQVAVEITALSKAFHGKQVFMTPAYPAMGRIVSDGLLYVNGTLLADSDFSRDPLFPVQYSDVRQFLTDTPTLVLDASTDDDLRNIAELRPGLLAGSGGLARAWVDTLPQGGSYQPLNLHGSTALLVCGSLHPASRGQALRAGELGIPVLTTPDAPGSPERVQDELLTEALAAIRENSPDLLLIFGGETAYRLLSQLQVKELHPMGEVLPGFPLSNFEYRSRKISLLTKAGGFGSSADMDRIMEQLT